MWDELSGSNVEDMDKIKNLPWLLVIILGAFALIRPVVNTVADQAGWDLPAAVPIGFTVFISLVWIAVIGLSRLTQPVLTLVFAGLSYGVLATLLSAVLSVSLGGTLQGPIGNPIAIVPMLMINAGWGLLAGLLALLLQRARGVGTTTGTPQPQAR